jgi:hypothetical protein
VLFEAGGWPTVMFALGLFMDGEPRIRLSLRCLVWSLPRARNVHVLIPVGNRIEVSLQ